MDKYYAGVGARATPEDVLEEMTRMGAFLGNKGFVLRSGGADGADSAFESGANLCKGKKEVFLPWPNFNGNSSPYQNPPELSFHIAELIHPYWNRIQKDSVKRLMARNVQQIFGLDETTWTDVDRLKPSLFVLCWTKCGAETAEQCTDESGGTGFAIRLASESGVPVFNMKNPDWEVRLNAYIGSLNLEVEDLSGAQVALKRSSEKSQNIEVGTSSQSDMFATPASEIPASLPSNQPDVNDLKDAGDLRQYFRNKARVKKPHQSVL